MAASERAPPGYAPAPRDVTRNLALLCALTPAALVAIGHELLIRQSAAYLEPGFGPPRALAVAFGTAAILLGAVAAYARRLERRLPGLLCALSLLTTSSALLWFAAFGRRSLLPAVAVALPCAAGALLGASALSLARAAAPRALESRAVSYWLAPLRLFSLAVALAVLAGLLSVVGLLRSAATLGAVLAALALWWQEPALRLGPGRARAACYGALAVSAAAFACAELLVPVHELRAHPPDVVYSLGAQGRRQVVVSARSNFELYSMGELRASSLDGHRYAESLAHPALALGPKRARVLLLGAADGLIEREVLRYRDVERLTVVSADRTPAELVRRALWSPGAARNGPELSTERLRLIEAEPIVWLSSNDETFDIVLVDLPDPVEYRRAKNFTVHFFRTLAERLAPDGSLAVQLTSPKSSPRAFSSLAATLTEASLSVRLYSAPIPTLGVWGFAWAQKLPRETLQVSNDPETRRVLAGLRFVDLNRISRLFQLAHDELPLGDAPSNTLPEQPVVELLHEERARLGSW